MAFFLWKKWLSLRLLREFLFSIIIFLCIYINYSIFIKRDYRKNEQILQIPDSPAKVVKESVRREQKDYSLFLKKIEKSQIFSSPYPKKTSPVSKVDRKKLEKIIKNLSLVGIVSGKHPRVAVEHKKSRKSFYLKEGEEFLEGIKVEKIKNGVVILKFDGEEFELSL